MKLLVVEDDPRLNELIGKKLQLEKYKVDRCLDGMEAREYLTAMDYDGVILDILLPGINGWELLRWMREEGNTTPVLLLTAMDTVEDRVRGLDAGADDYLVKPFAFEELLARVRAMLRRTGQPAEQIYTMADLTVDLGTRQVKRGDRVIRLTGKEFDILEYLLRNRGQVLSRERIGRQIWSYDYAGQTNVVDVYIRYLRKKLDEGFSPKLIHTIRGAGYVMREEP